MSFVRIFSEYIPRKISSTWCRSYDSWEHIILCCAKSSIIKMFCCQYGIKYTVEGRVNEGGVRAREPSEADIVLQTAVTTDEFGSTYFVTAGAKSRGVSIGTIDVKPEDYISFLNLICNSIQHEERVFHEPGPVTSYSIRNRCILGS